MKTRPGARIVGLDKTIQISPFYACCLAHSSCNFKAILVHPSLHVELPDLTLVSAQAGFSGLDESAEAAFLEMQVRNLPAILVWRQ